MKKRPLIELKKTKSKWDELQTQAQQMQKLWWTLLVCLTFDITTTKCGCNSLSIFNTPMNSLLPH